MAADNKAIQVVERKLQLEIVVPNEPKDLVDRVLKALNNSDGRYVAKLAEFSQDGAHILVKTGIRNQGLVQIALRDLAHELQLSFLDSTNTEPAT
jgi:hypothetical protein